MDSRSDMGNYFAKIIGEKMETIKVKTCNKCGSTRIKREGRDCGYSSAKDLGRLAGAKGRDEFIIIEVCQDCGSFDWEKKPAACHICGEEGIHGESTVSLGNNYFSGISCVYGIPDLVNICDKEDCKAVLKKEVERLVDEAFDEGAYDE